MLYERNDINFIEFDKPKLCETENLAVYGIFRSTIILSPVDSSVDPEVCYFLSYNERMQPTFFKRIDFTVSIHNEIGIYWAYGVTIIPHVGKMFLITSAYSILVLDLRTFEINQVLEYTLPYSLRGVFRWSKDDKMLNAVCHDDHPDQRQYLKFALYRGQTLKELALVAVAEYFSVEKIKNCNLPQSLVRQILAGKMY